jgi:1-acyl-sn-glycerol-3-phosphate acyltransferase
VIASARALCFYLGLVPLTMLTAAIAVLIWPCPMRTRAGMLATWNRITIWWLRVCCGVTYRVHGLGNLPRGASVVMCKHQSAWETIALPMLLPAQSWVLKRQLLLIPFLGWALAIAGAIPIDRSQGANAIKKVLRAGKQRLRAGIWVIVFPEGTRVAPGQKQRYARSAALLATQSGCPIVPIAHNSGLYWPRDSFRKRPGQVDMVIGKPVFPDERTPADLTAQCENWIETQTNALLAAACAPAAGIGTDKPKRMEFLP